LKEAFGFCNRDQDAAGVAKYFDKNFLKVLFRTKKRFTFALPIRVEPGWSLVVRNERGKKRRDSSLKDIKKVRREDTRF
jgi:hypothetical protein